MVKTVIDEKDTLISEIQETRKKIADLKHDIINIRAEAWKDAEGIADAKKDYVKSLVSELTLKVDKLEADIEYYYNRMKILDNRLEHE